MSPSAYGRPAMTSDDWFKVVYYSLTLLIGGIVFIIAWVYCIATYGFLFGVGLGWLPAMIVATLAGFAWPALLPLALLVLGWAL